MLRRKVLKGSKVSISYDLTSRNVNLIKEARDHNRIDAVWSWDGKVYVKGVNGHKFLLRPTTNIDIELEKRKQGWLSHNICVITYACILCSPCFTTPACTGVLSTKYMYVLIYTDLPN